MLNIQNVPSMFVHFSDIVILGTVCYYIGVRRAREAKAHRPKGSKTMATIKEITERMLKRHGIEYECFGFKFEDSFKGVRNGKHWMLETTCSWDGFYSLYIEGGYKATRISNKSAVKKILSL